MKKSEIKGFKEVDLYHPVATYFETLGYNVNGEVHHCDVMAVKEGHHVLIELKKQLNLDVVLQAVKRQRLSDEVYIAVFKDTDMLKTSKYKDLLHLLKRLELGLILVTHKHSKTMVEVALLAEPFDRVKSQAAYKKKRDALSKEFNGRIGKTSGGITQKKISTVYRENAVKICLFMEKFDYVTPSSVTIEGVDSKKIYSILKNNVYGWFENFERGKYQLSHKWSQDRETLKDLLTLLSD